MTDPSSGSSRVAGPPVEGHKDRAVLHHGKVEGTARQGRVPRGPAHPPEERAIRVELRDHAVVAVEDVHRPGIIDRQRERGDELTLGGAERTQLPHEGAIRLEDLDAAVPVIHDIEPTIRRGIDRVAVARELAVAGPLPSEATHDLAVAGSMTVTMLAGSMT